MNPHTMTLDEIRDGLAKRRGWSIYTEGLPCPHYLAPGKRADDECQLNHPIPATLEEAAKLPDGWRWARTMPWFEWVAMDFKRHCKAIGIDDTGDELTDRFRLRLLAEIYEYGGNQ